MKHFDIIIIGGGIIGATIARSILQNQKSKRIAILEKESHVAAHASGRNSGVLHSGFNLKPNTLKAKYCVNGNRLWREYCKKKNIACQEVGTIVLATNNNEQETLATLLGRGKENNVPGIRMLTPDELRSREPHATKGEALFSPTGSIVNGKELTGAIVEDVKSSGGELLLTEKVEDIQLKSDGYIIKTPEHQYQTGFIFNCAGLYADQIAHKLNVGTDYRIIPFRGDYYKIRSAKSGILNSMIYPVPDLNYPFLGVHWTKSINGETHVGPCAALAFGKESYRAFQINISESWSMITTPQFRNLWRSTSFRKLAWDQIKVTFSRKQFIAQAQRLIPAVNPSDFVRAESGNRAQLVHRNGQMVEDILVEKKGNSVHVLNAVSPGMTCALPFADYVVDLGLN